MSRSVRSVNVALVLLMAMLVLVACGGASSNEAGSNSFITGEAATNKVIITAKNWEFDQAVYTVKAGEPTELKLVTGSGVHGIEITKLDRLKLRVGESVVVKIDQPGTYEFACNILCGAGHAKMVAKLVVE